MKQSLTQNLKGKRGIVSLKKEGDKVIASKSKNPDAKTCRLDIEAGMLKKLNRCGIGPRFISFDGKTLQMEYIGGERILDFFASASKDSILAAINNVLEQCYTLDTLGIDKEEMTNPYKHIIVRDGKPVMIDFERARYTQKPKNVTQFVQFLTSANVCKILSEKGIFIDKEQVRSIAKKYKELRSA